VVQYTTTKGGITVDTSKERLIKNILFHMRNKQVTQADLARATGVTQQTVSAWTHGIASPRMDKIDAIARTLGITRAELIGGDDMTSIRDVAFRSLTDAGYFLLTEEDRQSVVHLVQALASARRNR
jgi:transcriptional regulator with XRE-family HTH domain